MTGEIRALVFTPICLLVSRQYFYALALFYLKVENRHTG